MTGSNSSVRSKAVLSILVCVCLVVSGVWQLFVAADKVYAMPDEFDVLREKWVDRLTGNGHYDTNDSDMAAVAAGLDAQAQLYLDTMNMPTTSDPYLWPGYEGGDIGDAETSYNRLRMMALAYASDSSSLSAATKEDLRDAVIAGLTFVGENWYNSSVAQTIQWYKFEIGVPKAILDLLALMYDDLVAQSLQAVIASHLSTIHHFSPDPADSRSATSEPRYGYMTGANLVEKALNHALYGILLKSGSDVALARDRIGSVFDYVESGDGFYADGSFIQHNTIPYTGSYGLVLVGGLPKLLDLLNDSAWEVTDSRSSHLYDWIYNSFEPVFFRGLLMDMVRGRAISRARTQDLDAGRSFLQGLADIAEFAPAVDAGNFRGMIKRWADSGLYANFYANLPIYAIHQLKSIVADPGVTEREMPVYHKQFPGMDRIVHHRPGFTYAISMFSNRISNYEYAAPPQEENKKGYYTGEGMTYLYNGDLRQFSDVYWPTVDPKRLPGITVDYGQERADGSGRSYRSPESWVGGTEIGGLYGAAGMRLDGWNNSLAANKSWFMFDDEVVALGSGISSTDNRTIETVIDNRRLDEEGDNALTVDGVAKPATLPAAWSETMNGIQWAHLAGPVAESDIGYYFPDGADVKGLRESRTATWSDINPYAQNDNLETPYTRNYLSLRFDHGANPSGGTYAYVLLPNQSSTAVGTYASSPDIEIIANTPAVQAVKEHSLNIVAANFWTDTVRTADIITSSKQASVMTQIDGDTLDVSVSDPTQLNTGSIEIEIDKSAAALLSADSRVTVVQLEPSIRIRVDVNGAKGQAVKASFELNTLPSGSIVRPAVADSFVKSGVDADVNYGSDTLLKIKGTTNANLKRKAYLKFDVSGLDAVTDAVLKLRGKATSAAGAHVLAYAASAAGGLGAWQEGTVTWNLAPPNAPGLLDSVYVDSTERDFEWDVTAAVQAALADDRDTVTIVLEGVTSEDVNLQFNSREAADGRPSLVVEGSAYFPVSDELAAVDDSFVRGGTYAGDNYGLQDRLRLYDLAASNANVRRKAYLKFDLSDYETIVHAKLRLYGKSDTAAQVLLYEGTDDSWSESGLTWNNAPAVAGSPAAAFQTSVTAGWIELDLTALAQSQLEGNGLLTIMLATDTPGTFVDINSAEHAANRPQLVVLGSR